MLQIWPYINITPKRAWDVLSLRLSILREWPWCINTPRKGFEMHIIYTLVVNHIRNASTITRRLLLHFDSSIDLKKESLKWKIHMSDVLIPAIKSSLLNAFLLAWRRVHARSSQLNLQSQIPPPAPIRKEVACTLLRAAFICAPEYRPLSSAKKH